MAAGLAAALTLLLLCVVGEAGGAAADCGLEGAATCGGDGACDGDDAVQLLQTEAEVALRPRRKQRQSTSSHHWPTAFGPDQTATTDQVLPRGQNLSQGLAWVYTHPKGRWWTVIGGGPVIDDAGSVYLTHHDGVRKLDEKGVVQWHYEVQAEMIFLPGMNNMVALMGEGVYGSRMDGVAFALDRHTGKPLWEKKLAPHVGMDSGYPSAHAGIFVVAAEARGDPQVLGRWPDPGELLVANEKVFGLNGTTGETLWEFKPDVAVWNFAPLFPGDDTTIFMDFVGGAYKLQLSTGELLWQWSPHQTTGFSDGGLIITPRESSEQMAFTCSNPAGSLGSEGEKGVLRALALDSGLLRWEKVLPQPCNSYPAAVWDPKSGNTTVVVTPGAFADTAPENHGSIMAFDASTGHLLWQYQAPVWTGYHHKNDLVGVPCVPAHWTTPIVTKDGAVVSVNMDGVMYVVRDSLGGRHPGSPSVPTAVDFATSPGIEAESFDLDRAALHGAFAFAPGVMAVATCDRLYYYKL